MKRTLILAAVVASASTVPAQAQTVEGEVAIVSQYLDDDMFKLSDGPVVQAGVYYYITDECTLDAWGSKGIENSVGDELDLGFWCAFAASDDVEISFGAYRYIVVDSPDFTDFSAALQIGNFDVTATYFIWDQNPDAFRVYGGYSIELTPALTLRPAATYQTGFGDPDIFAAGGTVSYGINDNLSFEALVLTDVAGGNERGTRGSVGLKYSF